MRSAAMEPAAPTAAKRPSSAGRIPRALRLAALPRAEHLMDSRPPMADEDTSLWTAWGRLRGPDSRHLVVVDHQLRPRGVLEERDLALAWPPGPLAAQRLQLRQLVAGRSSAHVQSRDDLESVVSTMLAEGTDAVTVVDDDGRVVGLLTVRHCLEVLARRLVS